jgi:hypothetical protein
MFTPAALARAFNAHGTWSHVGENIWLFLTVTMDPNWIGYYNPIPD